MSTQDPLVLRNECSRIVLSYDYAKGPLLILAGPGTGKTFSLLETMRTQIARGTLPKDFFVTTLTNTAVGDFEKAVKVAIAADFENVSTLHFRSMGIVRRHGNRLGLNPSFFVLTDLEKKHLLKEIQTIMSVQKKTKTKEVNSFLEMHEKQLASNEDFTINNFVKIYQRLKKFYNVIDWYDVSYLACRILEKYPEVLKEECNKQSFILVDEYQDLNRADQELIKLLSICSRLLVVGDDDQSIYSGRYADPSGIVEFSALYSTIKLPVCSRCPTPIIRASKNLIDQNDKSKRVEKPELIALPDTDKKADGGYIVSVRLKSAKEEASFLVGAIKSIIQDEPDRAKDIMVLCASRPLGLELMKAVANNIPDIPLEDRLTKDEKDISRIIIRYLERFFEDHNDNLALRMFLEMFFEIHVTSDLAKGKDSLWETLKKVIGKMKSKKVKVVLEKFIRTVASSEGKNIEEKLEIFAQGYPELKETIDKWVKSKEECEEEEKRLLEPEPVQGVQFMTIHSSKGLTTKYVFIPFMEEEVRLPAKDAEEQRRLLYVALTRARVSVVISWAFSRQSASRHKAGGGGFMRRHRSNFISECGITKDIPSQLVLNRLAQVAKISK